MASYKSSNFRRNQDNADAPTERGIAKIRQLQEMFPSWSDDDLKSLLQEVNYDVELAATRISEGHAEQWGAVTRKKDKRAAAAAASAASFAPASGDRGSSRAARGGRGGARGGRGGGGRGVGRGGHRETNGRHAPSPAPQASSSGAQATPAPASGTADAATSTDWPKTDGDSEPFTTSAWGDAGDWPSSSNANAAASSTPSHGKTDAAPTAKTNGATATPAEVKPRAPSPAPAPAAVPVARPAAKTPGTTKMSWAQIARPHEKPKVAASPAPAPPPAVATSAQPLAPAPAPAPAPASEPITAPPEPDEQPHPEADGWEEPTTAQAPTWDDEPSNQPTVKATVDGWITSVSSQSEAKSEPVHAEPVQPSPPKQPEPEPEHIQAPSAFPAQLSLQQKTESPVVPPAKPSTPVSYARSLNSRAGHRFKTDQAVVMPSTFGASVEKLGMQFGSVNLGSDDVDALETPAPEASAPVPSAPEPVQEPQATRAPPPEPAPAPKEQTPLTSQNLFQQAIPQQAQAQQPQSQVQPPLSSVQQTPPSLLPSQPSAQSAVSSQTAATTAASTPLTSFSAQQQTPSSQSSISPYQQHSALQQTAAPQPQVAAQNHLQQQHQQQQSQLHQQFSHFPSHLDQPASSQSPPQSQPLQQQQQQQQQHNNNNNKHRFTKDLAAMAPTTAQEAPYGSFAPLSQQLGYQTQNSHLGGFGSDHFGYNDAPRGFYDSYGQQSAFGGRSALAHDDLGKSLPGSQQGSQTGSALPQSASQTGQQQTGQQPQSASQPQGPAAGQPQGGYAPLPYFYNMYQPGQFYGPPYGSGYGMGQYANRYPQQQPPMFQPANPSSASPANAKGPNSVQPQSNPYAPGLYGQQHASSAYDDGYGHHNQLGPQHSQGVGGLPANDYGKPLYGGQGIQSFMSQSSTPAQLGQRTGATGTSPENSYKPYGPSVGAKDVGGAPGVGSGIAGGQGALGQAARGGVQQPQHSQFYGANRFSSNPGAGGPPGQQATQQQSQGYPQGAADNAFYYQRPSQNGPPYWG
ncbi:DEF1 [Sanghuangporus vaninii]